jgi:hypothetical protein
VKPGVENTTVVNWSLRPVEQVNAADEGREALESILHARRGDHKRRAHSPVSTAAWLMLHETREPTHISSNGTLHTQILKSCPPHTAQLAQQTGMKLAQQQQTQMDPPLDPGFKSPQPSVHESKSSWTTAACCDSARPFVINTARAHRDRYRLHPIDKVS